MSIGRCADGLDERARDRDVNANERLRCEDRPHAGRVDIRKQGPRSASIVFALGCVHAGPLRRLDSVAGEKCSTLTR